MATAANLFYLLPSTTVAFGLSFFFSTATIRTDKLVYEFLRTFITHTSKSIFKSWFGSALATNFILETLAHLL